MIIYTASMKAMIIQHLKIECSRREHVSFFLKAHDEFFRKRLRIMLLPFL